MSNATNDIIIEEIQAWCEQYRMRLSDVVEDEGGYFLEVNNDEKDIQVYLPKKYQKMVLGVFIKGYVMNH